jgi:hypothetical protein
MDRPRLVRLLRISISAASFLVCAAFVVLWCRSYSWMDDLEYYVIGDTSIRILSTEGQFVIGVQELPRHLANTGWLSSRDAKFRSNAPSFLGFRFRFNQRTKAIRLIAPIWFPVLASGVIAAVSGIRRPCQFSVRTLLVATTLVAVLLGAVVYAVR